MTEQKLKVTFDDPDDGWIGLKMTYGVFAYNAAVSYIFRSLTKLVNILAALREEQGAQMTCHKVLWPLEPHVLEFTFIKQQSSIALKVAEYPDYQRRVEQRTIIVVIEGNYVQICVPFWRALKSLQGRFSEEELAQRWHASFSYRELDVLTQAIRDE